jgi:hypothetical protein
MRAIALVVVFCVVFLIATAARAPLEPLLRLAGVERRGLAFERAAGTIWDGEVAGLRVGPERLGDVRLGLDRASLLRGKLRAAFEIRGPLRARGTLEHRLGGGWLLEDSVLAVSMTDMGDLHPGLKDRGGELIAQLDRAQLDGARTCMTAEGTAQTDVLSRAAGEGALGGWRGPLLEGAIACEGGDLVLRLAGADERARVAAEARIDLATGSTFVARVETEDPDVRIALGALGFLESDGAFAYTKDTAFTDG